MDSLFFKWVTDQNYYGDRIKYYFLPYRKAPNNSFYLCWIWNIEENMQHKHYGLDWRPYSKVSHKPTEPPFDIQKGSQRMINDIFILLPIIEEL